MLCSNIILAFIFKGSLFVFLIPRKDLVMSQDITTQTNRHSMTSWNLKAKYSLCSNIFFEEHSSKFKNPIKTTSRMKQCLKEHWLSYVSPQTKQGWDIFGISICQKTSPEYHKITDQHFTFHLLFWRQTVRLLLAYTCFPCTWPLSLRYRLRISQRIS